MNILMVIPAVGPVYGGPSEVVISISDALAKLGHRVDIATTAANGRGDLSVPINRWIDKNGVRIRYFPHAAVRQYIFSREFGAWASSNVGRYDIMHVHTVFSVFNLSAYSAAKNHRVPYVLTPHGMWDPWALRSKKLKKKAFFYLFEKAAAENACAVQYCTDQERRKAADLGLKNATIVIPNGVSSGLLESKVSPDQFFERFPGLKNKRIVLFMSRIDPKKGLDLLIDGFAKIKSSYEDARLVIAGPDNTGYAAKVKKLCVLTGCSDSVVFTGMLTGDLKWSALAAADIFALPSYSEGFSVAILEAMSQGLPCVFTDRCNFDEAESSAAAVITRTDPTSVAAALKSLLNDPDGAKNIGKNAKKLIESKYTWDKVAQELADGYQTILSRRKGSGGGEHDL